MSKPETAIGTANDRTNRKSLGWNLVSGTHLYLYVVIFLCRKRLEVDDMTLWVSLDFVI